MDGTAEGLQQAAATREALRKRKRADGGEAADDADEQQEEREEGGGAADATTASAPAPAASLKGRPPPTCTHEVAVPEGYDADAAGLDPKIYGTLANPAYSGPPARDFPFTLDPFQQTAVACLERRESVLVAAHTSAGKTAVAEYALALALKEGSRLVYTSPLKALSNQKYRELSDAAARQGGEVGLMTGDVSVNGESASVVVMTTEILRSMIYRGSELLREVAWVVFDEVHYMQDRERGVVWEEAIVFLDSRVNMLFLSATLSNAAEFAAWVAHLHRRPCHVVYTDYRPTPLRHFCFPVPGGQGIYKVVDEQGRFQERAYAKMRHAMAQQALLSSGGGGGGGGFRGGGGGGRGGGGRGAGAGSGAGGAGGAGTGSGAGAAPPPPPSGTGGAAAAAAAAAAADAGAGDNTESSSALSRPPLKDAELGPEVAKLVRLVKEKQWHPLIVFSFSRRSCERFALEVFNAHSRAVAQAQAAGQGAAESAGLGFNTPEEQEAVDVVFDNAVALLPEEDRQLPPLLHMRALLRLGIAVHHSGLLPLVKELVEVLFQAQLVKCLFATETFAMGLNMPARTCVFASTAKFDGTTTRALTSGEYIQMSGRAGRRGKDAVGTCIVAVDDGVTGEALRDMMLGKPSPLVSRFRLSYYTLLNLLRRREEGGAQLDAVVARSFQQFQFERAAPAMERELREVEQARAALGGGGEGEGGEGEADATADADDGASKAVAEYRELRAALVAREDALYAQVLARPDRVLAFLRPGRVVRVRDGTTDWGWGVVVGVLRRPPPGAQQADAAAGGKSASPAAAAAAAAASTTDPASYYVVDTLLACAPGSVASGRPRPSPALLLAASPGDGNADNGNGTDPTTTTTTTTTTSQQKQQQPYEAHVIPVALPLLRGLSSLRVAVPGDLRPADARRSTLLAVAEAARRYPAGRLPRLDPVEDMGIVGEVDEEDKEEEDEDKRAGKKKGGKNKSGGDNGNNRDREPRLARLVREVEQLETRLAQNAVFRAERRPREFAALARRAALDARVAELRAALNGSLLARFRREAADRERVLKALGHVDASGVVTLKGRAACEVDAGDELVLTELMFDGTLASLDVNLLAALLSCFVPVEQSQEQVALARVLAAPLARLQAAATRVAKTSTECGLPLDAEEYCEGFRPALMDVVYLWSRGEPFSVVSQRTDVFEGSLVRAVRRLDELMQQLALAAAAVGDSGLQAHVDASAATLRRGVMFAASLYI